VVKLLVVVVGRPGALLAEAIAEYERRAARYWPVEFIDVKEERASRGSPASQVMAAEAKRLLERVPTELDIYALTRTGDAWSSNRLSQHLQRLAVHSSPGAAFLIGGALGLHDEVLRQAQQRMRLSTFTLTHEMARLMLAEQLYRCGTIARGEPYHKGND
jgi:23S rRNA (pseudouridine1915-N3)-methyltransferase